MWLTHFWRSWSQFFIFAWDVTAGGILRTGVLICLVESLLSSYCLYRCMLTDCHLGPDAKVSDRYLIDVDLRVFPTWQCAIYKRYYGNTFQNRTPYPHVATKWLYHNYPPLSSLVLDDIFTQSGDFLNEYISTNDHGNSFPGVKRTNIETDKRFTWIAIIMIQ